MAIPLRLLTLFLFAGIFSACARKFVKPDLTTVSYAPAGSMESRLDFDLSREPVFLPEHFARKLSRRNIELYALRVRNYTPDTVWLGQQDLTIISDSVVISPIAPRKVYRTLRQPVAIHGLWFLLGPFVRTEGGERVIDYHPLGIAAVAWGVRNGIVAYQSNREVRELVEKGIPAANVPIAPSQTIYLLLPLPEDKADAPLRLRYTENAAKPATSPNGQQ